MSREGPIICFGEIVWDALPEGLFLGGAPLNVAYHLNKLGFAAYPVSRIGKDFLGEETVRRLEVAKIPTDLIQIDEDQRTGAVIVAIDGKGDASYTIIEPASWDFIGINSRLSKAANEASALVYGTLSTRSKANGEVLRTLIKTVPFKVCDVNLRSPHDDPENAIYWASQATVVKLNDEELDRLTPAKPSANLSEKATALAELLDVETLVVTRGGEGALLYSEGRIFSVPAPAVKVADTVGAGDAFTAAFISVLLETNSPEKALQKAIRLGGFVAGKRGAQPDYDATEISG